MLNEHCRDFSLSFHINFNYPYAAWLIDYARCSTKKKEQINIFKQCVRNCKTCRSLLVDEDFQAKIMFQDLWESFSLEEKKAMMDITGADLGSVK